jgi:hypothetical protein
MLWDAEVYMGFIGGRGIFPNYLYIRKLDTILGVRIRLNIYIDTSRKIFKVSKYFRDENLAGEG